MPGTRKYYAEYFKVFFAYIFPYSNDVLFDIFCLYLDGFIYSAKGFQPHKQNYYWTSQL